MKTCNENKFIYPVENSMFLITKMFKPSNESMIMEKGRVTKRELRKNIKFFTETDPIGKIVYERLEKF